MNKRWMLLGFGLLGLVSGCAPQPNPIRAILDKASGGWAMVEAMKSEDGQVWYKPVGDSWKKIKEDWLLWINIHGRTNVVP